MNRYNVYKKSNSNEHRKFAFMLCAKNSKDAAEIAKNHGVQNPIVIKQTKLHYYDENGRFQ